jgi:hypothetical protein
MHGVSKVKHSILVIKTGQLMLYREIIAVCSQIHTKHINMQGNLCLCLPTAVHKYKGHFLHPKHKIVLNL